MATTRALLVEPKVNLHGFEVKIFLEKLTITEVSYPIWNNGTAAVSDQNSSTLR
jgi:hypothetical protein